MSTNYVTQPIAPVADGSPPTTQGIANLSGGTSPDSLATEKGRFWSDIDEGAGYLDTTRMWLFRDRIRVGLATEIGTTGAMGFTSGIPGFTNDTDGAAWGLRSSDVTVFSSRGTMALTAYTRVSDSQASVYSVPIAVSGFVIADSTDKPNAWCFYADLQVDAAASGGQFYGMELALKNKGADYTSNPYQLTFGVHGIWLPAGGDNTYGGSAANPNNTAIVVNSNASTWNRGIVFAADGITGTDGTTGTGVAIEMAKGHGIRWLQPDQSNGVTIRSDLGSADPEASILFSGSTVNVTGDSGKSTVRFTQVTSQVNYARITASITANNPILSADGDDTNISMIVRGKGSGGVLVQDGGSTTRFQCNTTGIGFFAATPVAKPSVTGSRGGNAALASLLTALSSLGLVTDSSSA